VGYSNNSEDSDWFRHVKRKLAEETHTMHSMQDSKEKETKAD